MFVKDQLEVPGDIMMVVSKNSSVATSLQIRRGNITIDIRNLPLKNLTSTMAEQTTTKTNTKNIKTMTSSMTTSEESRNSKNATTTTEAVLVPVNRETHPRKPDQATMEKRTKISNGVYQSKDFLRISSIPTPGLPRKKILGKFINTSSQAEKRKLTKRILIRKQPTTTKESVSISERKIIANITKKIMEYVKLGSQDSAESREVTKSRKAIMVDKEITDISQEIESVTETVNSKSNTNKALFGGDSEESMTHKANIQIFGSPPQTPEKEIPLTNSAKNNETFVTGLNEMKNPVTITRIISKSPITTSKVGQFISGTLNDSEINNSNPSATELSELTDEGSQNKTEIQTGQEGSEFWTTKKPLLMIMSVVHDDNSLPKSEMNIENADLNGNQRMINTKTMIATTNISLPPPSTVNDRTKSVNVTSGQSNMFEMDYALLDKENLGPTNESRMIGEDNIMVTTERSSAAIPSVDETLIDNSNTENILRIEEKMEVDDTTSKINESSTLTLTIEATGPSSQQKEHLKPIKMEDDNSKSIINDSLIKKGPFGVIRGFGIPITERRMTEAEIENSSNIMNIQNNAGIARETGHMLKDGDNVNKEMLNQSRTKSISTILQKPPLEYLVETETKNINYGIFDYENGPTQYVTEAVDRAIEPKSLVDKDVRSEAFIPIDDTKIMAAVIGNKSVKTNINNITARNLITNQRLILPETKPTKSDMPSLFTTNGTLMPFNESRLLTDISNKPQETSIIKTLNLNNSFTQTAGSEKINMSTWQIENRLRTETLQEQIENMKTIETSLAAKWQEIQDKKLLANDKKMITETALLQTMTEKLNSWKMKKLSSAATYWETTTKNILSQVEEKLQMNEKLDLETHLRNKTTMKLNVNPDKWQTVNTTIEKSHFGKEEWQTVTDKFNYESEDKEDKQQDKVEEKQQMVFPESEEDTVTRKFLSEIDMADELPQQSEEWKTMVGEVIQDKANKEKTTVNLPVSTNYWQPSTEKLLQETESWMALSKIHQKVEKLDTDTFPLNTDTKKLLQHNTERQTMTEHLHPETKGDQKTPTKVDELQGLTTKRLMSDTPDMHRDVENLHREAENLSTSTEKLLSRTDSIQTAKETIHQMTKESQARTKKLNPDIYEWLRRTERLYSTTVEGQTIAKYLHPQEEEEKEITKQQLRQEEQQIITKQMNSQSDDERMIAKHLETQAEQPQTAAKNQLSQPEEKDEITSHLYPPIEEWQTVPEKLSQTSENIQIAIEEMLKNDKKWPRIIKKEDVKKVKEYLTSELESPLTPPKQEKESRLKIREKVYPVTEVVQTATIIMNPETGVQSITKKLNPKTVQTSSNMWHPEAGGAQTTSKNLHPETEEVQTNKNILLPEEDEERKKITEQFQSHIGRKIQTVLVGTTNNSTIEKRNENSELQPETKEKLITTEKFHLEKEGSQKMTGKLPSNSDEWKISTVMLLPKNVEKIQVTSEKMIQKGKEGQTPTDNMHPNEDQWLTKSENLKLDTENETKITGNLHSQMEKLDSREKLLPNTNGSQITTESMHQDIHDLQRERKTIKEISKSQVTTVKFHLEIEKRQNNTKDVHDLDIKDWQSTSSRTSPAYILDDKVISSLASDRSSQSENKFIPKDILEVFGTVNRSTSSNISKPPSPLIIKRSFAARKMSSKQISQSARSSIRPSCEAKVRRTRLWQTSKRTPSNIKTPLTNQRSTVRKTRRKTTRIPISRSKNAKFNHNITTLNARIVTRNPKRSHKSRKNETIPKSRNLTRVTKARPLSRNNSLKIKTTTPSNLKIISLSAKVTTTKASFVEESVRNPPKIPLPWDCTPSTCSKYFPRRRGYVLQCCQAYHMCCSLAGENVTIMSIMY